MQRLVKAKEAATALGMGIGSLYRMARTEKISGVYLVGQKLRGLRFDLEEIRLSLRRPVAAGDVGLLTEGRESSEEAL